MAPGRLLVGSWLEIAPFRADMPGVVLALGLLTGQTLVWWGGLGLPLR
jgi:hypothetical protein